MNGGTHLKLPHSPTISLWFSMGNFFQPIILFICLLYSNWIFLMLIGKKFHSFYGSSSMYNKFGSPSDSLNVPLARVYTTVSLFSSSLSEYFSFLATRIICSLFLVGSHFSSFSSWIWLYPDGKILTTYLS